MAVRHSIFDLKPHDYKPHRLHLGERDWPESNCYVDLYIGILQGLGLDPYACLGFTLSSGFEHDHFTFFKPPLADLRDLYGLNVQELILWRSLPEHLTVQIAAGNLVSPEVDSYYLPDTRATDYRTSHVKTTISVTDIDVVQRTLSYFHNAGFYELSGDDFDGLFRVGQSNEAFLPPYCELIKLENLVHRPTRELVDISLQLARQHFKFRPADNPMRAYGESLKSDLEWLVEGDLATYHAYVFANLRQCGASFEFSAFYLRWLQQNGAGDFSKAADHFAAISATAKMLILKLARIVNTKRVRDLSENLLQLEENWDRAMEILSHKFST